MKEIEKPDYLGFIASQMRTFLLCLGIPFALRITIFRGYFPIENIELQNLFWWLLIVTWIWRLGKIPLKYETVYIEENEQNV